MRPLAPVDVQAEDARRLAMDNLERRISINRPVDAALGVLGQADPGRCPLAIRQVREVEMPICLAALRRSLMPGVDEPGAFPQRVAAERLDVERARRA